MIKSFPSPRKSINREKGHVDFICESGKAVDSQMYREIAWKIDNIDNIFLTENHTGNVIEPERCLNGVSFIYLLLHTICPLNNECDMT